MQKQKQLKYNLKNILEQKNKALQLTHATSNLGIWLNGKNWFVLGRFGKSERLRLFNPKLLVARERWQRF